MKFELQHTDSKSNARAGLITTDHGTIQTPIFMPVGTVGSVKAVQLYELKNDIEAQIIGHVMPSENKKLTVKSAYGEFEY